MIRFLFAAASIFSTLSCASLSQRPERDPASVAEACSDQVLVLEPAKLSSQTLFQLQEKERVAQGADLLSIYDQEFQHVDLMIKKSRLYSTGLVETVDPRLVITQKALALIKNDLRLTADSGVWSERLFTWDAADRPSPTDDQVQTKAADLIRKNQTPRARALLLALSEKADASLETRLSARLDLLRSFRFQGSDDEFLKQLEVNKTWYAKAFLSQSSPTSGAVKQYSSFLQALIRGHIKKEKFDLAQKEIALLKKFLISQKQSAAGSDWMMGRLQELRAQPEEAKQSYEATLQELPSDDVTIDQVNWQLGWTNYKTRNFARSAELWSQLPMTGPAQVLARNLYWTGRAEFGQGHREKADQISRSVLATYPGTFYAPLAARDLAEKIRPLTLEPNTCEIVGRVIARMKLKYAAPDVAAFASFYRQRDLPRAKQVLMDLSLAQGLDSSLFLAAAAMGDYQPLILGFQKLSLAEQKEIFEQFPQFLFPNPYPDLIAQEAKRNSLDPYFPLSTIRQESVFAPLAVSFADARGLMQVLPSIGETSSAELHLEHYSTERLFEPATNILIGTKHLKEGFEANHESFILTLAAYNAGDEIAAVWERHLSKQPLEFIEDIPFSETNGYVKAILRNEIYNRALYGQNQAFDFPEFLLKR